MQLEINSALNAQLSTFPESDRKRILRALIGFIDDPYSRNPKVTKVASDLQLRQIKISPKLRALVRLEEDKVVVLAVMRPSQLARYLGRRLAN
jgi:hypothetical protein